MKDGRIGFWEGLFFPPICRGCGVRQDIFSSSAQVLCPDCRAKFSAASEELCPLCGVAHTRCRCTPPAIFEAGGEGLFHLAAYEPGGKTLPSRLILRLKDHPDRALLDFFSTRLAALLLPQLLRPWETRVPAQEVAVVYVPRQRATVRLVGHDQAAMLAGRLGRCLGVSVFAAVRRTGKNGKQQKSLDARERWENAARSFALHLRRAAALRGKTVVLVDDICTSGASLAACVALLKAAGVERVICAVIGKVGRSET